MLCKSISEITSYQLLNLEQFTMLIPPDWYFKSQITCHIFNDQQVSELTHELQHKNESEQILLSLFFLFRQLHISKKIHPDI